MNIFRHNSKKDQITFRTAVISMKGFVLRSVLTIVLLLQNDNFKLHYFFHLHFNIIVRWFVEFLFRAPTIIDIYA